MPFQEDSSSSMEAGKAKYGSANNLSKKTSEKKPMNIGLVVGCLAVPLLIFIVTYYTMSFSLRYWASIGAYAVAAIMLLSALGLGGLAASGDRWFGLMSVLGIAGWIWAMAAANENFLINMQPYNDLQQLTVYKDVDPSKDLSNQYLDFGILGFVKQAELDPKLSMSFKNRDTYCVAPVKVSGAKTQTYDYWAVGMNCCGSHHNFYNVHDFQCGGWNNPRHEARSGVRVMRESNRAFYQLAASQAAAAYDIPVGANPIFFEYVADPAASINALQDDGMHNFVRAIFNFFCLDLGVVVIAMIAFSKL